MPLDDKLKRTVVDVQRVQQTKVSYRMLADQLKAAILIARSNGLGYVQVTDPLGNSYTKELATAQRDLEQLEQWAAGEAGGFFSSGVGLT
jgi:hypothetical protein